MVPLGGRPPATQPAYIVPTGAASSASSRSPAYAVGIGGPSERHEGPPTRIIHDVPPSWDGKDPDMQLEPYLKLLSGWLITTRTLDKQRGMTILQYSQGDLKHLIDSLDIVELTATDGGQRVFDHIKESFAEYLERKLPKAIEKALFVSECQRHGNETMVQYISRKKVLFNELEKAKCPLPSNAKGYLLLRDAKISERAWDMIDTWTRGTYEFNDILEALRKLERPVPGRSKSHLAGMSGYVSADIVDSAGNVGSAHASVYAEFDEDENTFCFMTESLFLVPEAFDEDLIEEFMKYVDDVDILWVAGDISDDFDLTEDEAIAILANYGQVRKYIHKRALSRGFVRHSPPDSSRGKGGRGHGKGRGKGGFKRHARPKRWSKKFLMSRSTCARCGKKGHWARECKNEPDERGKRRGQGGNFLVWSSPVEGEADEGSSSVPPPPVPWTPPPPGLPSVSIPASSGDATYYADTGASHSVGPGGYAFNFPVFAELDNFVGLEISPEYGLLDTGAQHAVVGEPTYQRILHVLAHFGLKPRVVPTLSILAQGVGGSSKFLHSSELPLAIRGVCGTLTCHCIKENIPLLLPVDLCKKLGMILNMPDLLVIWKNIKKTSKIFEVGAGGHLAVPIFEFPVSGWENHMKLLRAIIIFMAVLRIIKQ